MSMRRPRLSIDNPFAFPILSTAAGLVGFIAYTVLSEACEDAWFPVGFVLSLAAIIALMVHWAGMLERVDFRMDAFPTPILVVMIGLKALVAARLLAAGASEIPDARFEAFGSASFIALNSILDVLFFPLVYVSTRNRTLRLAVLIVYVVAACVTIYIASSKSSLIVVATKLLFLWFLLRKERGLDSRWHLFGRWTLLAAAALAGAQILITSVLYGTTPLETTTTAVVRAGRSFDGAIFSCLVQPGHAAPNSFFVYSLLPLLKRLDASYYDIEYYNVPQWLLGEVFDISPEGRFVFPNDNLFVATYFSLPTFVAPVVLVAILFAMHLVVKNRIRRWKRTGRADPLDVALVVSMALAYLSTQEFVPLVVAIVLLKACRALISTRRHRTPSSPSKPQIV